MTKYAMHFANCFTSRSTLYENVYFLNYVTKRSDKRIMCQILCLNWIPEKLPAPYNLNSKRHEMSFKFNPCSNAFKSILKIFLLGILLLILYIKSTIEVLKRYSWFDIPIRSISFFFLKITSLAIVYYWVKMSYLIFTWTYQKLKQNTLPDTQNIHLYTNIQYTCI